MKTLPLYAGLDVHQEFTVGTVLDEMGNAVRELKVPTNEQGYKRLFYDLQNVTAVFEAGRNWRYIAGLLKPYCTFKMAHPLKVRLIASARIKTDEIDELWTFVKKSKRKLKPSTIRTINRETATLTSQ